MALKNGRTSAALQTILIGSVIPPGVIQAFGGGTVPSGWLLCDGSTASRSTYAGLFAAVGIVHGEGNGTTTFHLPDLRGRFLRGADDMGTGAAGRDPGDNRTPSNAGGSATGIGSVQSAETLSHTHIQDVHTHIQNAHSHLWGATSPTRGTTSPSSGAIATGSNGSATSSVAAVNQDTTATNQSTGGTETRPQNANSSYIIKV